MPHYMIWGHRGLALILALFLAVHLLGHLAALHSISAHTQLLEGLRQVYRHPLVEPILLLGFCLQILLGLSLAWRRFRHRGKTFWSWVQLLSGAYLAMFLVLHVSAALLARTDYDLDTNFYWPAGTLILSPLKYGFAPYYFFGVLSVFTHFGAALHFAGSNRLAWTVIVLGAGLAIVLIATLGGALYPIELPDAHKAYFASYLGVSQ